MQHAVDPVADDEAILERLDVNVGRARVERVGDDERDEPDHRRLRREVLQLLDVGVEREVVPALLDVADDLADCRAPGAVEPFERRIELVGNRDHRLHVAAGDELECADRVRVGRIGHRERQLVFVLAHGKRVRFAQEPRRDALLEDGEFRVAGGVDERQAELRGKGFGDVALRAHAERHQQRTELFSAFLLHAQRAIESRGIHLAALDKDLADAFANRRVHA